MRFTCFQRGTREFYPETNHSKITEPKNKNQRFRKTTESGTPTSFRFEMNCFSSNFS